MEEHGYQQYYYERWQCRGNTCYYGSWHLFQPVADKGTHVYRQRSRTALRYCNNVDKILLLYPVVLVYHLTLYYRYHGIAATKSKQTDTEECLEKICVHIASPPTPPQGEGSSMTC